VAFVGHGGLIAFSVGAGLLANAFPHPPYLYLTHRVRQQAGSYRVAPGQLIVPTLLVVNDLQTLRVSQTTPIQPK
jgi:hypothetical protein